LNHVRAQLRHAVRNRLGQLPTTDGRAYASRVYSYDIVPAIGIWTLLEEINEEYMLLAADRFSSQRMCTLVVEIRAKKSDKVDDELDQISAEVEAAMAEDETWGGLAVQTLYLGFESEMDSEAEQPAGVLRQSYRLVYNIDQTDPTTP